MTILTENSHHFVLKWLCFIIIVISFQKWNTATKYYQACISWQFWGHGIGHFQVVLYMYLFFNSVSLGVQPFIRKWVFIHMQLKLIFIWKVVPRPRFHVNGLLVAVPFNLQSLLSGKLDPNTETFRPGQFFGWTSWEGCAFYKSFYTKLSALTFLFEDDASCTPFVIAFVKPNFLQGLCQPEELNYLSSYFRVWFGIFFRNWLVRSWDHNFFVDVPPTRFLIHNLPFNVVLELTTGTLSWY